MNGHDYHGLADAAIPVRGLLARKAIADDGKGFILVQEIWDLRAPDAPMCMWPRGTIPPPQIQRTYVMYRAEAQKAGLIR